MLAKNKDVERPYLRGLLQHLSVTSCVVVSLSVKSLVSD